VDSLQDEEGSAQGNQVGFGRDDLRNRIPHPGWKARHPLFSGGGGSRRPCRSAAEHHPAPALREARDLALPPRATSSQSSTGS
jgi:hypothetical protein